MALLRAACRRGVRGPREGSQALALCHWRRTFTPPGELKRGGIINKSALTGLRVKGVSKEQRLDPCTSTCPGAAGSAGWEKTPRSKGKQLFIHS